MLLNGKTFLASLETALVSGLSTFAATLELTNHPTSRGIIAAATAAGVGALYEFSKSVGVAQAASLAPKAVPS